MAAVQRSAAGWSTAQIAILGLLGIAGVSRDADQFAAIPSAVQVLMGAAALIAFACAAAGALLIARAAFPLYRTVPTGLAQDPVQEADDVARAQRRLRRAIPLTIVSLVFMGLAFALSWWPVSSPSSSLVEVHTGTGTVCGPLVQSTGPALAVRSGNDVVAVSMTPGVVVRPVTSCP
ncbi:hypothetical protein [Humibacillus xanthopallidus]|uniref:hypothetical protein n=1 Tax=Humibacillus xanthopallidus TaxID=412689 RepID=UPI00384ADBEC